MRKLMLSLTAASAIVVTAAVAPVQAMGIGTVSGLQTAIHNASVVEDAAYVCQHRYYTSRRVCYWRPTYRRYWRRRYW